MAAAGPHMLRSTGTVAVLEPQEGSQIGFGKWLYTEVWVSKCIEDNRSQVSH